MKAEPKVLDEEEKHEEIKEEIIDSSDDELSVYLKQKPRELLENDLKQNIQREKKKQTYYSLDLDDVKCEESELNAKK
jgi:hypothetical protein